MIKKTTVKVSKDTPCKAPVTPFVKKFDETKCYPFVGKLSTIDIVVEIDYENNRLSVLNDDGCRDKQFVFTGRSADYVQGWCDILDAIKNAVTLAGNELREYKQREDEIEQSISIERAVRLRDILSASFDSLN